MGLQQASSCRNVLLFDIQCFVHFGWGVSFFKLSEKGQMVSENGQWAPAFVTRGNQPKHFVIAETLAVPDVLCN